MSNPHKKISRTALFAIITTAVAVICACIYILMHFVSDGGTTARILTNGEVFAVIDLDDYTGGRSTTITVSSEYSGGENIIEVSEGKIRVISASCPDKVCIHQGERGIGCSNTAPITCLPNRMTIVTENKESSADAVSGIN